MFVLVALLSAEHISNFHTVASFEGDPKVVALANESGLNMRGKALFLSQSPELVSANELHEHCPRETVIFGCYIPGESKIYILEIPTEPYSQSIPSTIAHETLHVAWEELSFEQRESTTILLDSHLAQQADAGTDSIKESLQGYEDDREVQINETYAFVGSELPESSTDDALDRHYRRYFFDRDKSADAHSRYSTGVDNVNSDLAKRRSNLEHKLQELNDYEARWITPFETALQRDLYYGDYYTYNQNVEGYNNNIENFNALIDAYEQERAQFNADLEVYNAAMAAMQPDRKIQSLDAAAE